jgi:hypothetical protein
MRSFAGKISFRSAYRADRSGFALARNGECALRQMGALYWPLMALLAALSIVFLVLGVLLRRA